MLILPLLLACSEYKLIDQSIPPEEQASFLSKLQSCLSFPSDSSYPTTSINTGSSHIYSSDLERFKEKSLQQKDANKVDFYEATGLDEETLSSGKFSAQVIAFHRGCLGGSDNYAQNFYRIIPDLIDSETKQFETDLSNDAENTDPCDYDFPKPYVYCSADLDKEFGRTSPGVESAVFIPGMECDNRLSDRLLDHWMTLWFEDNEVDHVTIDSIDNDWPTEGNPNDANIAYIETDDPAIQSTRSDAQTILYSLADYLNVDMDSDNCDQDGTFYHFGLSGFELE